MPVVPGTRLGAYEIVGALGAGGMGEVHRARDTKLGRDVALKLLPEAFARDPQRLGRFQREAQILAALNHPHIAQIYGLEDSSGSPALVMELVEGATLAERLGRGPLPLEETLAIARQVADAFEAAHDKGIVHRDLKPGNIIVAPGGTAKVLDFGLAAIATDTAGALADGTHSPTLSIAATGIGMILGTAAYMAPEQAAGKAVDKRADIWSFGVVLWEMLTGARLFHGETVSHTLADVLRAPIDFDRLPRTTPPQVRELLRRCLDRDTKTRLRDIGEARIAIDRALTTPSGGAAQIASPGASSRRSVVVGGVAAAALVAAGPNGRALLWVRSLDSVESRPLAGTEGTVVTPFWSPDSRFLAFGVSSEGRLKEVDTAGGPPQTLCEYAGAFRGGAWSHTGVIVCGFSNSGLMRVAETGGSPAPLTQLESGRREEHWGPTFLRDGRRFLYYRASQVPGDAGICLGSLDAAPDNQTSPRLLGADSRPVYVPSPAPDRGHLLFLREAALLAQPFDERTAAPTGTAIPVAKDVGGSAAAAG